MKRICTKQITTLPFLQFSKEGLCEHCSSVCKRSTSNPMVCFQTCSCNTPHEQLQLSNEQIDTYVRKSMDNIATVVFTNYLRTHNSVCHAFHWN